MNPADTQPDAGSENRLGKSRQQHQDMHPKTGCEASWAAISFNSYKGRDGVPGYAGQEPSTCWSM